MNYIMENNKKIDTFQKDLNEFIESFYNSDEYKNFKRADRALYESKSMMEYNAKKQRIEAELNELCKDEDGFNSSESKELMESFNKLKENIKTLDCVKDYEKAYQQVKNIRDIFNREILRKLYL